MDSYLYKPVTMLIISPLEKGLKRLCLSDDFIPLRSEFFLWRVSNEELPPVFSVVVYPRERFQGLSCVLVKQGKVVKLSSGFAVDRVGSNKRVVDVVRHRSLPERQFFL